MYTPKGVKKVNKFNRTKAVFFDYGGTLDAPGIAWRDHFYPIYLEVGIDVSPQRFAKAFYAADDSLVSENPVHMNLSEVVQEQVKRVLHHLGAYDQSMHQQISQRFLQDTFSYVAKIRPVLEKLKAYFQTGIISNNYGNLENICRELGIYDLMDVLVDSNIIGYTKPHERIFHSALTAIGEDAGSSVMVGDSMKRDIRGAEAAGMAAIWLVPAHGGSTPIEPHGSVTVITKLDELLNILLT